MSAWNFMSYESKENLLEAVRRESTGMFELAADPESWTAPTGAGHWQVRDVFGHLIDTTETYFVGFDAVRAARRPAAAGPADRDGRPRGSWRAGAPVARPRGGAGAAPRGARQDARHRGGADRGGLGGLLVPHKFMDPLPGVLLPGASSSSTTPCTAGTSARHRSAARPREPFRRPARTALLRAVDRDRKRRRPTHAPSELGVRITSGQRGDTHITVGPDGLTTSPAYASRTCPP